MKKVSPLKIFFVIFTIILLSLLLSFIFRLNIQTQQISTDKLLLTGQLATIRTKLDQSQQELSDLQNSDQVLKNKQLSEEILQLKNNYQISLDLYQQILNLKENAVKVPKLETLWADILSSLAKGDPTSSATKVKTLATSIQKAETDLLAAVSSPVNLPVNNSPPSGGTARQTVETAVGNFAVDIISADLKSTKVVVDTASDSSCQNNCPVMSLADYAKRKGAFAAINGPYFCPETYPACADKKNSFDTLLMNINKTYFNSDNNVYSQNPVAIFSTTSRFVAQGQEWGRDTGVDSVIMSRPLLVFNNEIKFFGNNDTKETLRGTRAFIGATDSTVYIGVVRNVTVAEMAQVIAKLGIRNALNLDSGGSIALWSNGKYLAGPGRNTPFGILLVKR